MKGRKYKGEKKKMINLSEVARQSLGIEPDQEITEELLKSICNELMDLPTDSKIDITEQDEDILSNYINSRKVMTWINGNYKMFDKDYVTWMNSMLDLDLPERPPIMLSRFTKLYPQLNLKGREFELSIRKEDLENLSDFELEEIKERLSSYQVKKISFYMEDITDIKNADKLKNFSNVIPYFKDSYDPEESLEAVKAIAEKIKELTSDIKDADNEFDKFSKIYTKLAKSIAYDYEVKEIAEKSCKGIELLPEEKKKARDSQNLMGLLTRKNSLCRIFKNSSSKFK